MAGRPPTATALKLMQGTTRPDRARADADLPTEVLTLMPAPPAWMRDGWAITEWMRLGPTLLKCGLLTEGNLVTFAQLCATHGAIATGYEKGVPPVASMIGQYRALVAEFGLTPASAAKVKAPDPVQQGNKFRTNGKR